MGQDLGVIHQHPTLEEQGQRFLQTSQGMWGDRPVHPLHTHKRRQWWDPALLPPFPSLSSECEETTRGNGRVTSLNHDIKGSCPGGVFSLQQAWCQWAVNLDLNHRDQFLLRQHKTDPKGLLQYPKLTHAKPSPWSPTSSKPTDFYDLQDLSKWKFHFLSF